MNAENDGPNQNALPESSEARGSAYRALQKGERILATDEFLDDNDQAQRPGLTAGVERKETKGKPHE